MKHVGIMGACFPHSPQSPPLIAVALTFELTLLFVVHRVSHD